MDQFWVRVLGLFGILGGLILFAGDMLLYYDPISTNFKQNMGNASDFRIIASGVCALLASWFYMIGLGQVYFALKPTKLILKNIILMCFGSILISYGVVHGAYLAIATTAKLSVEYNLDMNTATFLAEESNAILRVLVYPIFAILSVLFISQVWKGNTLYPRWIIIFFPLIPFLIEDLVCKYLPDNIWVIVSGGYLNLILVVFFTASTIALWSIREPKLNDDLQI